MNIAELHLLHLKSSGICTDTRRVQKGNIFFALKGDNFNGNEFAEKAINLGCDYAIIDEKEYQINLPTTAPHRLQSLIACQEQISNYQL